MFSIGYSRCSLRIPPSSPVFRWLYSGFTVLSRSIKLILFFDDDHAELYDLRRDVGETKAQLPAPNPNYDPEREPGPPMGPVTTK